MQQEFAHVPRLALQDLFDQVVDDVAVVTGETLDELPDVVAALHRERRQLERGDPAFGPACENGELACREVQCHHVLEVRRGLVGGEPQIGRADLNELAAGAQPSERQRWVGAAGNHQVDMRRETVNEEGHSLVDLAVVYDVEVIQHERQVVGNGAELVEQRADHEFDRRLRRIDESQSTGAHGRRNRLYCGDHICPESRWIVVALVKREPCR